MGCKIGMLNEEFYEVGADFLTIQQTTGLLVEDFKNVQVGLNMSPPQPATVSEDASTQTDHRTHSTPLVEKKVYFNEGENIFIPPGAPKKPTNQKEPLRLGGKGDTFKPHQLKKFFKRVSSNGGSEKNHQQSLL